MSLLDNSRIKHTYRNTSSTKMLIHRRCLFLSGLGRIRKGSRGPPGDVQKDYNVIVRILFCLTSLIVILLFSKFLKLLFHCVELVCIVDNEIF